MYSNMFQQWIQRIRRFFESGSLLSRLILINIGVWLLTYLAGVVAWLFKSETGAWEFVRFLAVPADLETLISRPWTVFTYMFLHERFWHIFFNMYMLWFGGTIFLQHLTERHLLRVYIIGGLAGAFLYIFSFNVFPVFADHAAGSAALGASASVLAILIAIAAYRPNHTLNLVFFGPVKLKYLALIFVLIDLFSIQSSGNAGGHIAHLGGAIAGFLYIFALFNTKATEYHKKRPQKKFSLNDLFPKKKKNKGFRSVNRNGRPLSDEEYNANRAKKQKEIDRILEKIARSGYDSLSSKEKEMLFKQSKQ